MSNGRYMIKISTLYIISRPHSNAFHRNRHASSNSEGIVVMSIGYRAFGGVTAPSSFFNLYDSARTNVEQVSATVASVRFDELRHFLAITCVPKLLDALLTLVCTPHERAKMYRNGVLAHNVLVDLQRILRVAMVHCSNGTLIQLQTPEGDQS